jgi:feruloyl esterase
LVGIGAGRTLIQRTLERELEREAIDSLLLFVPEAAHIRGLGAQMRNTLILISAFGLSTFTSVATAATACERLSTVPLDHAVVTDARLVPEGPGEASTTPGGPPPPMLPAHCRVQLDLKPTPDSLIKMEVWLPLADKWNGKFLGAGNGGFAGSIQGLRAGMPEALNSGYATAGTDTGHQEPGGKWAIGHPEKMIDFAYRSTHEMTLKAKQLVQSFYDKAAQRSYFSSCSTGGRMAVMEAQRYPEDYDGIVAGALANRHIRMWAAGITSSVELMRHPEGALSKEQAVLVNDLVTKTCDVRHEGFLNDPRQCKVDFASLLCAAGQSGNACLTKPQLKTVATFYAGVKNSKGELIFSGAPLSRPIAPSSTNPDGPNGLFDLVRIARNDAALDWKTFDVDRDVPLLDQKLGFVDAVNPDLSKFKARGGKLLLYHGWADPGITAQNTIRYYESVLEKMGPEQGNWVRLFMLPGMGHCRGGPGLNGFDSTRAIEQWVEQGIAPKQLEGHGANGLTRPLCPYPQLAQYSGSGDTKDGRNWSCKGAAPKGKP